MKDLFSSGSGSLNEKSYDASQVGLKETERQFTLAEGWLTRMTAADRWLWWTLPKERRAKVARRLDALLRYEAAGHTGSVHHAGLAGMGKARFIGLASKWKSTRTLAAVVPYAQGAYGEGRVEAGDEQLVAAIAERLEKEPGIGKDALARELGSKGRSLSHLRRLIDRERGRLERRTLGGASAFGSSISIDQTAVELPVRRPWGATGWAVAAFVVDRATGLLIGWATDVASSSGWLNERAVARSLAFLDEVDGSGAGSGVEPRLVVVVGGQERDDPISVLRETRRLLEAGVAVDVVHGAGDRRFGQTLLTAAGPSIGKLALRTRSASDRFWQRDGEAAGGAEEPSVGDDDGEVLVFSQEELEEIVSTEVAAHNAPIIEKGFVPAVDPKHLQEVLKKLFPGAC